MDPNAETFRTARARMDDAERAEFDAYVTAAPEGSAIMWRCTSGHSSTGYMFDPRPHEPPEPAANWTYPDGPTIESRL